MNLLLDSHIFVWWCAGDRNLSRAVEDAIAAPVNTVHVSLATAWELAIKQSLGQLRLPEPFEAMLERALPIRLDHVRAVMHLPFHHRDPFDRMLVAQAQHEGLVLVSADRRIARYDVPVLA
jgi:PIN domain nuclease of toxin-antitoxin system